MTIQIIEGVTKENLEQIVNSIVLAFSLDPIARWMYPSPQQYLENFPNFVRTFASKSFDSETVDYADGYLGAAVWFLPNTEPDSDSIGAFVQQTVSCQQQQEEIFAMFEQMDSYHPHEPYWYLALLGVEPFQQKKGYGRALLKHRLSLCDRQQQIAYLESSSLKNVPFYEQQGFEVIGKIQAGNSPTIFPMVRHPQ